MLKFLSKRRRSQSLLLYLLIGLMCVGLIGFFTVVVSGEKGFFSGAASNDSTIAKVASYKITVQDMRDQLTAFSNQISQGGAGGAQDVNSTYSMYGPTVLKGMIRNKLVLYEADQLGLMATDDEVRNKLGQLFNPWPGASEYKQRLLHAGYSSPEQFEQSLRAEISEEKLRSYITAGVQVTPQEVEDNYKKQNTNYDVRYVEVQPDNFKDKVQVTDNDLQTYFNSHKSDFHINGEQRKAKYLFIDQNKAGELVQVSDDDLKKDFNPERGVKQVRVSEIVLNVPKETSVQNSTPDDETRKKAQALSDQAKGDNGKPGADFASLAKENSQDKSKANGGDIGWVNKDDKRDSDDPLNRVFSMKVGEVSPPVKKGDKYYILKVTDRKIPTFEESKPQLLKEVRATKAYSKAVDVATDAEKKFKESKNADSVVAELNKQYGADILSVKETPFFNEGDKLPDLGVASDFESEVFQLQGTGEVGDKLNVTNGFAVPQFESKLGPHDPNFDEVKSKVEDAYRASKAKDLAKQKADELAKASNTDALKSMAEAAGLKPIDKPGISGNDPIGPLMTDSSRAAVYKLNDGQVTPAIKEDSGDSYVVVGLMHRKDADMGDAFKKQRASIESQLLQTKTGDLFETFLDSIQKQMTDEGKIKIYQSVLDSAFKGAADVPGGIPGMPGGGGGMPLGGQRTGPRPRRVPVTK